MKTLRIQLQAVGRRLRCLVIVLLVLAATLVGLYVPNLIYYFAGGRDGELVAICFLAGVPCAVITFTQAAKAIPDNDQGQAPADATPNTVE